MHRKTKEIFKFVTPIQIISGGFKDCLMNHFRITIQNFTIYVSLTPILNVLASAALQISLLVLP